MEFLPNKIFLKIAHFFGCLKDTEHISDITINIDPNNHNQAAIKNLLWGFGRPTLSSKVKRVILDAVIKEEVYKKLESDKKLEQRCRKVRQLWLTFYTQGQMNDKDCEGSIMKRLLYKDGVLYFDGYGPDYEAHKELYPNETDN